MYFRIYKPTRPAHSSLTGWLKHFTLLYITKCKHRHSKWQSDLNISKLCSCQLLNISLCLKVIIYNIHMFKCTAFKGFCEKCFVNEFWSWMWRTHFASLSKKWASETALTPLGCCWYLERYHITAVGSSQFQTLYCQRGSYTWGY